MTFISTNWGGGVGQARADFLRWGLIVIGLIFLPCAYAASSLDSLLQEQKVRAGGRWREFQRVLDHPPSFGLVSEKMVEDYRFLLAYLPLSDLAFMSGTDLAENIVLSYRARQEFPWGEEIPEEIWQHFVIPHRISQEPYTPWRRVIWAELALRVEGLDMRRAALEVNHWCHEWATYKPTDRRDQDPLTTMRSGWGRCEEEMIFTIAALRSVGIPARQCFTPYWAHMDDNHAWVEVWVDGRWHYLGACEPAQDLNQAWFTGPAQRAMLVISTAYGEYQGTEPVIKRFRRSTLINSTSVYGPTRVLKVGLMDEKGKPLVNQRLIFSLFNYGSWMPILSLLTDSQGWVEWECGRGDLLVTAGVGQWGVAELIKGSDRKVQLILHKGFVKSKGYQLEYQPPPEKPTLGKGVISLE
ncbi:MAG: transglutaminase-like domain-containing protein, partial [bacterium]